MSANGNRFFLYTGCNDLAAMRGFYSRLLGLEEIFFVDGPEGGLAYHVGDVQLTIFPSPEELPVGDGWHRQPGWSGGRNPGTSWSIQIGDWVQYRSSISRLLEADVSTFRDEPAWVGYWSFPVRDPMGNTVELTHVPEKAPEDEGWV